MRKMKKFLACVFGVLLAFSGLCFCFVSPKQKVVAEALTNEQASSLVMAELEEFLGSEELKNQNANRFAGSDEELFSAMFIKSKMEQLSSFVAVDDQTTKNGVQSFEFISSIDKMTKKSQNIVFRKETTTSSKKKVVLGTNYDIKQKKSTTFSNKNEESNDVMFDGANESASSIAVLLAFAKLLDKKSELGFTIEIVFFGAGTENYAGSDFYVKCLSNSDCANILAMINLDKVGLGENNYFYVNEFENSQTDFVKKTLKKLDSFKKIETKNMLHISQNSPNGLPYTHIALESDHSLFMARHINVVNFFSGAYENLLTVGTNEYDGEHNITYTKNDNLEYISENVSNFSENVGDVLLAVQSLVFDKNFVLEMEKNNGSKAFYEKYDKEKAVYISIALLFVMFAVFNFIFLYLRKRSLKTMKESGKSKVVFKIVQNIGEGGEELSEFIDEKVKKDTNSDDDEEKE